MRVLVTGSNGLLGTKIVGELLRRPGMVPLAASRGDCTNRDLGEFRFFSLDITDSAVVRELVEHTRPDVAIHTAAMTDVDGCERDPTAAWAVNVGGTRAVAEACGRRGVPMIHLSTEYVFDGTAGPYAEDDAPRPISVYGETKLAGERLLSDACERWTVARTTVVYGYAPHGRQNFVLWLLQQLRHRQRIRVVADQVGSPTLAENLADMVLALAGTAAHGVYHTVGATRLSRYEFARLAAEIFGLDTDLIEPIATSDLKQPAPRPLQAGLVTERFRREFPDVPLLHASEGLEAMRRQLWDAGWLAASSGTP